jgi:rubrerythrin
MNAEFVDKYVRLLIATLRRRSRVIRRFSRSIYVVPTALALLLSSGVAFAAGNAIAVNASTKKDLAAAMHGEAYAYLSYLAYADQARANNNVELAKLFEKTANSERFVHFAGHGAFAQVVGSDVANLKTAIAGENYENTIMYPEMAKRARESGDEKAAAWFATVGSDEARHRDAFQAELNKIGK